MDSFLENYWKKLQHAWITWIENRQTAREELTNLAEKLKEHQINVNIAKVTGTSAVIAGAGLMIGGFVASFFTFGTSLIVSAVGAGISGAGGITAGGAGIVKHFLDGDIYKEAQKSLDRDQESTKALQSYLDIFEIQVESFKELGILDHGKWDNTTAVLEALNHVETFGEKIVYGPIKAAKTVKDPTRLFCAAADLATDSGLSVFKSLSNVGRALHIGGFVIGVVSLPKDINTLVTLSIELHEGNTSEAEKKIRDIVDKLKCPTKEEVPDIMRILKDLVRTERSLVHVEENFRH